MVRACVKSCNGHAIVGGRDPADFRSGAPGPDQASPARNCFMDHFVLRVLQPMVDEGRKMAGGAAAQQEGAMDRSKVEAWTRFYDQGIGRGRQWPRELWFAAVEDALAAALGPDAQAAQDYRRDVAELLRIEQKAERSERDEERLRQLTEQIRHAIGMVDGAIRSSSAGEAAVADGEVPVGRRFVLAGIGLTRPWLGSSYGMAIGSRVAFGLAMFGAGLLGATWFYEGRLGTQLDRQLAAFKEDVERRVAGLEPGRNAGVNLTGRAEGQLLALRDELTGNVREFSAVMADAIGAMNALRQNAIVELERRLDHRAGDIARRLGDLHQRADLLDRGLDQVSKQLAAFERRLPELGHRLDRKDARLHPATPALARTAKDLAEVPAQGFLVAGPTWQSGLEPISLGHANTDGVFAYTVEKPDLVTLSDRDAIDRAEAQALRQLEAERAAAIAALSRARQEHLEVLAGEVAAMRSELDRTRAGLIAGWQTMDRTAGKRQRELLASLDAYAGKIEAQVGGFVRALETMIAQDRS
jgi:hypothetical protein